MNEMDIYNGLGMIVNDDDTNSRADYGTPRHSGRYPWGSGEKPQRHRDISQRAKDLKKMGLTEKEIANELGYKSSTELRAAIRIASNERRKEEYAEMQRLYDEGYGYSEIGRMMGKRDTSVRAALNSKLHTEGDKTTSTAEELKQQLEKHKYIDIGEGVENYLNVSKETMKTATEMLKQEGYQEISVKVNQLGTKNGQKTTIKVLAPPGSNYWEVKNNMMDISSTWMLNRSSEDGGNTFRDIEPPQSIDSKRVYIRYSEDGGSDKDGVIELRPGVEDLDLGEARYAQVRIAVDNEYYLKGMAVYNAKDIPEGYDVLVNSNKPKGTPSNEVFKKMKKNPDGTIREENPFGAMIQEDVKQRHYIGKDGKEHLNAVNIVNQQGDWSNWKKSISPQFLSKQPTETAKKQLDLTYSTKKAEYDEIMSMTNPIVKQHLLQEFSDECDASSVHLKAAGFARQQSHVILPINSLKDNEVYAPNYNNGEPVVLVRFPHAGKFELPLLKVNNRNQEAKDIIGPAPDAIGINKKVANQLSGADFDGDTVLVIPVTNVNIKTEKAYKDLVEFDTKKYAVPKELRWTDEEELAYSTNKKEALKKYPELKNKLQYRNISSKEKGNQMGQVTNLITDMTIKGANTNDIIRAVKHSMVVIDSEKHYLDWKASEKEFRIAELRERYQKKENGRVGGSSTLISLAKSPSKIEEVMELTNPNSKKYPMTEQEKKDFAEGKKIFRKTGKTHFVPDPKAGVDENGKPRGWKEEKNLTETTKMAQEEDALKLSSGSPIENIYGRYANKLKSLANDSRKEMRAIKAYKYDKESAKTFKKERQTLNEKLNIALKNKPLERAAQVYANDLWKTIREGSGPMDNAEQKKEKAKCLETARKRLGAKKTSIYISDREWEAIQSHAISSNQLKRIIDNADKDRLKELAMPKTNSAISDSKIVIAKARIKAGWTQAEVANELGISVSLLNRVLAEQ